MEKTLQKQVIEAALLAAGQPLTADQLQQLFAEHDGAPSVKEVKQLLEEMVADYENHSFTIKKLASGYVFQVKQDYADWIAKLWEQRPQKYTRALLETLAITAYRQPVTRAEIESIRGVSVSSSVVKTLMERDWVQIVGHKDVPGRPGLYGTTKAFLDHFNLSSLEELPTLAEIKDLDQVSQQFELALEQAGEETSEAETSDEEAIDVAEMAVEEETSKAEEISEETAEEEAPEETTEETLE